jgi:epoxyqueuosine reductase
MMSADICLADELRRIGRQAGLDSVGICDAGPFTHTKLQIQARKEAGESAGMQFTFRNPERSTNPQVTMPGARALFVGARRYIRRRPDSQVGAAEAGSVARYSWVDHYRPLREALGVVADRLLERGWRAQVLVDHNALVDRAAAVRAGLGWFGKNTNVLLPEAGSWFVIGSVLTDAPIATSVPVMVANGCGSCHRCLDDCPTGALVSPGRLDARKCLAWLLQAPGVFPAEYRVALGDRIYGCDACQESCPVNRLAERRHPLPEAETGAQAHIDVLALLGYDDAELDEQIGRWYIPGRDFRFVRRNALIVLGNIGNGSDPRVSAALVKALSDEDPIIRAHGVWAAARLGRHDLLELVRHDTDPLVTAELESLPDTAGA